MLHVTSIFRFWPPFISAISTLSVSVSHMIWTSKIMISSTSVSKWYHILSSQYISSWVPVMRSHCERNCLESIEKGWWWRIKFTVRFWSKSKEIDAMLPKLYALHKEIGYGTTHKWNESLVQTVLPFLVIFYGIFFYMILFYQLT